MQFALLEHKTAEGVHWDLLLETAEVGLATWSLPSLPEPGVKISVQALPDHRAVYLDYEGPISGDRGEVRRVDRGTYTVDTWDARCRIVRLDGERFRGRVVLEQTEPTESHWHFVWDGPQ